MLIGFRFNDLKIKINDLISKHMLICWAAGFIYRNEGSQLAKFFLKSLDCLDAFELLGDNFIGEAIFGG